VLGILGVALALRLVYFAEIRSSPFFGHPIIDARDYVAWAREIAGGNLVWDEPRLYTPGYPYFLAGLARLTGDSLPAMTFANAVLGCAWIVLLVLALRGLFPWPLPEVSGIVAAAYWPFMHHEADLLSETLFIFLCVLAFFLLARRKPDSRTARDLAVGGFVLGLATITRPNAAVCVPFLVLLFAAEEAGRTPVSGGSTLALRPNRAAWWRRAASRGLPFLAGFAVVATPVVLRTHELTGLWALRPYGWINVYLGNRPDAPGYHVIRPGRAWNLLAAEPAREAAARTMTDHERYFRDRVTRFATERPGDFLALQIRKLALFFHEREIRVITSPHFFDRYAPLQSSPLMPDFGWVGGPAIVGLCLAVCRGPRPWLLLAFTVPPLLAVVLTVIGGRYRLPVVPFLIPFAAYALVQTVRWIGRRRWGPAGALVGALAAAGWFVNRDAGLNTEERFGEELARVAFVTGENGDVTGAFAAWDAALREEPTRTETWVDYAAYALQSKDPARAEGITREALRRAPGDFDLLALRGRAFLLLGAPDSAATTLSAALEIKPDDPAATADLARVLYDLKRVDDSIAAFRRSLRANNRDKDVLLDAAHVLVETAEARKDAQARAAAIAMLTRVRELDPTNIEAMNRLRELNAIAP
jgi:hypothetical protein